MVIQTSPRVPVDRYTMSDDGVAFCSTRQRCYYCRQQLGNGLAIQWRGEHDLYFHAGCAVEFNIRLMTDAHDVERITKQPITKEGKL